MKTVGTDPAQVAKAAEFYERFEWSAERLITRFGDDDLRTAADFNAAFWGLVGGTVELAVGIRATSGFDVGAHAFMGGTRPPTTAGGRALLQGAVQDCDRRWALVLEWQELVRANLEGRRSESDLHTAAVDAMKRILVDLAPAARYYTIEAGSPDRAALDGAGYVRSRLSLGYRSLKIRRTYGDIRRGKETDLLADLPGAFLRALGSGGWGKDEKGRSLHGRAVDELDAGIQRDTFGVLPEWQEPGSEDPGFDLVDARQRLEVVCRQLSAEERELFTMQASLSDEEIGGRLGITAHAARLRREKLYRTLRRLLKET